MRPRVLWLIKGLERGGAETLLVSAARHLDRDRHDVEVAYLMPQMAALEADLRALDVPVHCLGMWGWSDVGWVRRLRRLVRARGYAIVHTHSPAPAAVARLALPGQRPLFVHTEHNVWPLYRPLTRWANALTLGRNAAVLAVSDAVAASVRTRRGRPPVEVRYHGVDPDLVRRGPEARADARRLLGLDAATPVVGCMANFNPEKDHATLVEAFALVARDVADARLVLAGLGPTEPAVAAHVRRAGLDDRVTLLGSRDDVAALLPGFDVVVLPSRREGLGLVLVEALAAGVPCVASDVDGIPEVVAHGETGFLTRPGDAADLAAAMTKLLVDPALRAAFGAAGVARAERFSIAAAVTAIQDRYDALLA